MSASQATLGWGLPPASWQPSSAFSLLLVSSRPSQGQTLKARLEAEMRRAQAPAFALALSDRKGDDVNPAARSLAPSLTFMAIDVRGGSGDVAAARAWLSQGAGAPPRLCVLLSPTPLTVPVLRNLASPLSKNLQALRTALSEHFAGSEDQLLILSAGGSFSEVRELSTAQGKIIGHEVIVSGARQPRLRRLARFIHDRADAWHEHRSEREHQDGVPALVAKSIGLELGAGFAELHVTLKTDGALPEPRIYFHLEHGRRSKELAELLPADTTAQERARFAVHPERHGVLLQRRARAQGAEDVVHRCLHLSGSDRLDALIRAERSLVLARRSRRLGVAVPEGAAAQEAAKHLTGLALSGGGIRSATVSLGFMRELQEADRLREYDYVSSVSGGSYASGYLQVMTTKSLLALMGEDQDPAKMFPRAFKCESIEALHERGSYLALGSGWRGHWNVARLGTSFLTSFVQHWVWLIALLVSSAYLSRLIRAQFKAWFGTPLETALLVLLVLGGATVLARMCVSRDFPRWHPRVQRLLDSALNSCETFGMIALLALVGLWFLSYLPDRLFASLPWLGAAAAKLETWASQLDASARSYAVEELAGFAHALRWLRAHGGLGLWISVPLTLLLTWGTSPNSTSLHRYYAARLADAFLRLKATRLRDSVRLAKSLFQQTFPLGGLEEKGDAYGPYPLFNGCLNLLGNDPAFAGQQTGDYFIFSPAFCGAKLVGYAPTAKGKQYGSLTLAEAVTCSGAAISPFQGRAMPSLKSTLLWLLNLRTDLWLSNPMRPRLRRGIPWGPVHELRALLGSMDTEAPFINVSDGAFIDSLGVYELLRRRCRLIVAVDATWDPSYDFHTLRNLVQRARLELKLYFDFRQDPNDMIRPNVTSGISQGCVVTAIIRDEDRREVGEFFYVKSAVLSDAAKERVLSDPSRAYGVYHPEFPQESTGDQFFDAIQWQAYHDLGRAMARELLNLRSKVAQPPRALALAGEAAQ